MTRQIGLPCGAAHSSPRETSSKVSSRSEQLDGTAGGDIVNTGCCDAGSAE